MPSSASEFVCLFSIAFSFLFSGIFLIYSGKDKTSIRVLSVSYLLMNIGFLSLFLLRNKLILQFPHFYRLGVIAGLLYMPLSFLFVRSLVTRKAPRKIDWLHGLPLLLFIADYLPFFLSSASHKIAILNQGYSLSDPVFNLSQGWLFPGHYLKTFILIQPLAYIAAEIFYFSILFRKKFKLRSDNQYWLLWLYFYLVFHILMIFWHLIITLSGNTKHLFYISPVFTTVFSLFIILSIMTNPSILLNQSIFKEDVQPEAVDNEGNNNNIAGTGDILTGQQDREKAIRMRSLKNLSQEQIASMKENLETLLNRERPFLRAGYSIQEMATSLDLPLYQLSALINQECNVHFNDLINRYRIDYALELIHEGCFNVLNVNGLSTQSGFNNRNTFSAAFKKFTGYTPSEYVKKQKHTVSP